MSTVIYYKVIFINDDTHSYPPDIRSIEYELNDVANEGWTLLTTQRYPNGILYYFYRTDKKEIM